MWEMGKWGNVKIWKWGAWRGMEQSACCSYLFFIPVCNMGLLVGMWGMGKCEKWGNLEMCRHYEVRSNFNVAMA